MTSAKHIYLGARRGTPTPPLPYDAEVEYLESTGSQWIDTGIQGSASLEISCRFKRTDIDSSTSRLVYGAYVTGGSIIGCGGVNSSSHFSWNAISTSQSSSAYADTSWHDSVLSTTVGNKFFKLDGEIVGTTSNTNVSTGTMPIILFGRNPNTSSGTRTLTPCSISTFSINAATTGQLLIDLISVRFTNEHNQSEGAMYDRVSGQLFRNAGTGEFGFGTDIAGRGYKWLGYSPLRFSRSTRLWKEAA